MEDSAMDMTGICNTNNGTKLESNSNEKYEVILQENYELKNKVEMLERANKELENELTLNLRSAGKPDLDLSVSLDVTSSKAIFQENYELKKKIEILEKVNHELESDINYATHRQAKDTTKLLNVQEELGLAASKIKHLESTLEEKQYHIQRLIEEAEENKDNKPETKPSVVLPDQEQLNILTLHIEKLEIQREEEQHSMKELIEEKHALLEKLNLLKGENEALRGEINEVKEHLSQKTTDTRNLNSALESLREEKLLMNAEIQLLKASDSNAPRGNSLFAEVEDNRQKVAAQRELLKIKYLNLKKIYNQKQAENNKLKLEIVKIRREEKEDEKGVHHDYNTVIETYKQRVWELEERVNELEKKPEPQPISMPGSDDSQWMWVNTMVENARKETRSLQEELDRRGSRYVDQAHQLLASQKENRKLKSSMSKLQSDLEELKIQLDTAKAVKENTQDQDGISPPATEVAIEYQKQKMVRFKETLSEQVKNISKHNSSASDPDTSLNVQDRSLKEANTSVTVVKEENKENISY